MLSLNWQFSEYLVPNTILYAKNLKMFLKFVFQHQLSISSKVECRMILEAIK